ncbi:SOS response-associated peptidase family protein [Zunongwangia sp. F260]|uniref:Abasic site processing protein n=1 Tax=Autumnicola lenta TaxID=3075593 RepID=A0ABU3CJ02_9FLAO|nr:SOS response-associated peptidase family protein [Zunongwangia sp. F260]MDT0646338.1 SOS response-associated peptidase family protein [Zunongwangia sp. F260]
MCYETSLTKTSRQIEARYGPMKVPMLYEPWYHVSGFVHPNLFCIPMENPKEIYPMEWGLIAPFGERDVLSFRRKYNTLNAKAETLLTSKMYQVPTRERRCLIIADGFFEPHYKNLKGSATPYYCYLEERKLFTFAGIYNEYKPDYWNVSLITREANSLFAEIHNKKKRMPLVLDPDFEGEWINPDLDDNDIQEVLATSFMREPFKAHPVTRDLYKRDINTNTPRVIEEVEDLGNLFDR